MCRISSRYPVPQSRSSNKRKRKSIHPSRAAAFFHMFLSTCTATLLPSSCSCNHSGSSHCGSPSTRPGRGSRSLVRCSNARTSPRLAVPLVQSQCASRSCHRGANTETAPSHHCHLTLRRLSQHSRCAANNVSVCKQRWSLQWSARCTVLRQRVATLP
ncbi:hypothetical protein N431DRAFT_148920 [Stipitochalara longipes BDJ]|nr:hypothetical protein N431DRAFT_148920 [Stipitochalara longipes BDJ]